jgi:hypothetical protein
MKQPQVPLPLSSPAPPLLLSLCVVRLTSLAAGSSEAYPMSAVAWIAPREDSIAGPAAPAEKRLAATLAAAATPTTAALPAAACTRAYGVAVFERGSLPWGGAVGALGPQSSSGRWGRARHQRRAGRSCQGCRVSGRSSCPMPRCHQSECHRWWRGLDSGVAWCTGDLQLAITVSAALVMSLSLTQSAFTYLPSPGRAHLLHAPSVKASPLQTVPVHAYPSRAR